MSKNPMSDYAPQSEKINSIMRGVVECNNDDPDKIGGCRIRVFGLHTPLKKKNDIEGIPTNELPMAYPCLGLFGGSVSGYGAFTVPLQGSHVMVFFENGNIMQPRYFATVPGKPTEKPNTTEGFNDPSGVFPEIDKLNESDFHRLTRNENTENTILQTKKDNLETDTEKADGSTYSEPEPSYETVYPNNTVIATSNDILIEVDNTPDSPRLHIYHPSNSYIEIDKDGNVIIRNNADKYEIVRKNKFTHINIDESKTIDNDKLEHVGNDKIENILNDKTVTIGANRTEDIEDDEIVTIGNDKTEDVGNNKTVTIGANWDVDVGANCNITVTGACVLTSPATTLTGGTVTIQGAVNPTGTGALCGIPFCLFTGAPQTGPIATGT